MRQASGKVFYVNISALSTRTYIRATHYPVDRYLVLDEKNRKLMKLWDLVQGGSINILSSFGSQGPCSNTGGHKTANVLTFLRFFFDSFFPLRPTSKAFPLCFVER